jgi:hypothetical protein
MKLKTLLTISAIYLGVLGVGFMLAPRQLGIDAVPPDALPRSARLSPDFRRSNGWDCGSELAGQKCGAFYGAGRNCPG